ncbi:Rab3 GTPase-activating protein catalytic subunit, partial [Kappamyces sp. JEL0680]
LSVDIENIDPNTSRHLDASFVPGSFESAAPSSARYYLDSRDVTEGMRAIMQHKPAPEKLSAPIMDASSLIAGLRDRNTTVPRGSLLWGFCKRIFDSLSMKPAYLRYKVELLPLFHAYWRELLLSIHQQVNANQFIAGVNVVREDGSVGIATSHNLLHQKLCMLNCALSRKLNCIPDDPVVAEPLYPDWEELDDVPSSHKPPADARAPDGASDPLGRKKPLAFQLECGEPAWEPFTQQENLLTTDQFEEQERIFETLGASSDGQQMRVKMQSAQLISGRRRMLTVDMQSFKAANPQCVFEDFVKWHSPRDWTSGGLSNRFKAEDNTWKRLWALATPAPSAKQKPLFDHEREVAKALHYLDGISLKDALSQLRPTFYLIAYDLFAAQDDHVYIPAVCEAVDQLSKLILSSRDFWLDGNVQELFQTVEEKLVLSKLLYAQLPHNIQLRDDLVRGFPHSVGGKEREAVFQLFKDSHAELPSPSSKEYTLEDEASGRVMNFLIGEDGTFRIGAFISSQS